MKKIWQKPAIDIAKYECVILSSGVGQEIGVDVNGWFEEEE